MLCSTLAVEDEAELLEAWRGGDRNAGSRLIAARGREITWFFRNKVFHEDAVADLVSQTFLRCVAAKTTFEGATSFRRFVYAIAKNVLREYLRTATKRAREEIDFEQVCLRSLEPRSMSSLHSEKRQVHALLESLRDVSIDDQIVLELKYFEGLSGSEIADALGIPEGTVRGRLARGLARLRTCVAERLQGPHASAASADELAAWAGELRRLRGAQ